jgi:hypothetical protein
MIRSSYLWFLLVLNCALVGAQPAEPILTRTALPNPAGTVSVKLDFVSPLGSTQGVSSQALPEARLEIGLGHGFETVFQMPLLRLSEPSSGSVLAGGQFSMALQYLLAGSLTGKYAISVWGRLEVPTGDSAVVGNAAQLMPMVLVDWQPVRGILVHSNVAWNTTISGTTKFANLQHANSLVWMASRHLLPVLELAGSTSTLNGGTQLVIQPELIVAAGRHLEIKTGVSVWLAPNSHYAIRSQVAWFWGKRG